MNPNYPEASLHVRDLKEAASALGLRISVANAEIENGVDGAIAMLARRGVGGLLVANDPFLSSRRAQIVALAARYALPASYSLRESDLPVQLPTKFELIIHRDDVRERIRPFKRGRIDRGEFGVG